MSIVDVNVFQTQAPTPTTLQRTGILLSQGGTNTVVDTLTLLTQPADFTPFQQTPKPVTTATWNTGIVTVTTTSPHGFTTAATFNVIMAGFTPAGFNGTFLATVTGPSAFTYPLASTPGTMTAAGTYVPASSVELQAMVSTFFGNGVGLGVYILELGATSTSQGVAVLAQWLIDNPATAYCFLIPRGWDANADFLALGLLYSTPESKTYFWTTTTDATYAQYPVTSKCFCLVIESPGIAITEYDAAAFFYRNLAYRPSGTNKVAPFQYGDLFAVTAYPRKGMAAKFAVWKANGINWVGDASEGGITGTIVMTGQTRDSRPINYWYAADWVQINIKQNIAAAVINGSNDKINPLYDNQQGINRLQAVGAGTLSSAVTFGMVLGKVTQTELDGPDFGVALDDGDFAGMAVINAIPFVNYYADSPGDYKIGEYDGFSCVISPLRGFDHIIFNVNLSDFVASPAQ